MPLSIVKLIKLKDKLIYSTNIKQFDYQSDRRHSDVPGPYIPPLLVCDTLYSSRSHMQYRPAQNVPWERELIGLAMNVKFGA